jgi:Ser-tRNA(Ala) deacylase AlaX
MHTAEHILNRTMDLMFGCGRSFNAHIERRKSKCDYRFPRLPTPQEISALEEAVNRVIQADLPVTEHLLERSEAERRYDTGKLPPEAGERIRIVAVGDYDDCPCIGPHVRSTGEIPAFRIVSSSCEGGVLRIRFTLKAAGPVP